MAEDNTTSTISEKAKKLRKEYTQKVLGEHEVDADPFVQFTRWFDEAVQGELYEPNAMILSTVSRDGQPTSRTVLLKEATSEGFIFYTNYESKKGREIEDNPRVALLFLWGPLERQIRIEGRATKIAEEKSREYFYSRPRSAQIGAHASPQSRALPNRETLEARFTEIENRYAGLEIPYPQHWGGYIVLPASFEFWQGRESRLHDRIIYTKSEARGWGHSRIAP